MPRARNGKSGGYQTRSVSRLGGWVRWIGCAAVWEADRAVCRERHLCSAASAATARAARVLTRGTNPYWCTAARRANLVVPKIGVLKWFLKLLLNGSVNFKLND